MALSTIKTHPFAHNDNVKQYPVYTIDGYPNYIP